MKITNTKYYANLYFLVIYNTCCRILNTLGCLDWSAKFSDISTLVGYLILNPVYRYLYIVNIYDL